MHTRVDFIVLLAASFLIGGLFALTWKNSDPDTLLVTTPTGNQNFTLEQTRQITIKGRQGTSTIEIKNNLARFIDSKCSNKICVQQGHLDALHPVIACIPNGVSIQFGSAKKTNNIDAFAF